MGEDRVYLASVRQEVGLPLRTVAVAMTDFSEPPLELLQIAVCRVAELRVSAKAAPNIVKRLLASLGVEAARRGIGVSPSPSIPHFHRSVVVDKSSDLPAQRFKRLRSVRCGVGRLVS